MFIYQHQFHIQIQITYQDEQVHKSWATQHFLIGNQLLIQGLMIQTWKNIKHHVKMTKMVCINQIWQSWPHVNLHTQMTYKRYSNAWEVSCNHAPHRGHMKVQTAMLCFMRISCLLSTHSREPLLWVYINCPAEQANTKILQNRESRHRSIYQMSW